MSKKSLPSVVDEDDLETEPVEIKEKKQVSKQSLRSTVETTPSQLKRHFPKNRVEMWSLAITAFQEESDLRAVETCLASMDFQDLKDESSDATKTPTRKGSQTKSEIITTLYEINLSFDDGADKLQPLLYSIILHHYDPRISLETRANLAIALVELKKGLTAQNLSAALETAAFHNRNTALYKTIHGNETLAKLICAGTGKVIKIEMAIATSETKQQHSHSPTLFQATTDSSSSTPATPAPIDPWRKERNSLHPLYILVLLEQTKKPSTREENLRQITEIVTPQSWTRLDDQTAKMVFIKASTCDVGVFKCLLNSAPASKLIAKDQHTGKTLLDWCLKPNNHPNTKDHAIELIMALQQKFDPEEKIEARQIAVEVMRGLHHFHASSSPPPPTSSRFSFNSGSRQSSPSKPNPKATLIEAFQAAFTQPTPANMGKITALMDATPALKREFKTFYDFAASLVPSSQQPAPLTAKNH